MLSKSLAVAVAVEADLVDLGEDVRRRADEAADEFGAGEVAGVTRAGAPAEGAEERSLVGRRADLARDDNPGRVVSSAATKIGEQRRRSRGLAWK